MTTYGRPMRIALIIGSAHRGGAEHQLIRLAVELARRGATPLVLFLSEGGPLTSQLDAANVEWEVLSRGGRPVGFTARLAMAMMRLSRRLIRWRPDIVFAWMSGAVWCTLPLAALLCRAKRIAAFRGATAESGLLGYFFRLGVAHAHAVTINAPHLREVAIRWGASGERVFFIPNGVDIPAEKSDVGIQPPVAVVIANFIWYKGHDVLVDALQLVQVPLTVLLIGAGTGRGAVQQQIERSGVSDVVRFVADPADVPHELAKAQFAIHPSYSEGLPNAVLEELASGLPVVASDVGGIPVLIEDGLNGFLVTPGDKVLLAQRISELAASPALRRKMAVACGTRASEYGWDACVEGYLQLFDGLIGIDQ